MKLLFANRYFAPDISATSQILSDAAASIASEHAVQVLCSDQLYSNPKARLPRDEDWRRVQVRRLSGTRFGREDLGLRTLDYGSFYVAAAVAFAKMGRRDTPLVTKTDPPLLGVIGLLGGGLRGTPLVQWLQDLFPEIAMALDVPGVSGIAGRVMTRVRDLSLRKSRAVICIGERMRERVVGLGVPPNRVVVCPNWALSEGNSAELSEHPLRYEWGLGDKFVVGYSGNMGRVHEFETILRAGERLRDQTDVAFIWIGDGAQRRFLEDEVKRRGLRNWMFKPYQPRERLGLSLSLPDIHLVSLLPAMEGLIVPSKFYGIIGAGRATLFVGDPDGEIARIVRRHDCGRAFRVGDAEGLARTIRHLADHRGEADALGARAKRLHDCTYNRQNSLRILQATLDAVAAGRAPSTR